MSKEGRFLYKANNFTDKVTGLTRVVWDAFEIKRPDFTPQRKPSESQKRYRERQKQIKLYCKAMKFGNRCLV